MAHEPEPSIACASVKDLHTVSSVRWKGRHKSAIVIKDSIINLSELSLCDRTEVE
jgi:hypothetical protein